MALLGQTSPHSLHSGKQYDSVKSILGVRKLSMDSISADGLMMLVGQTAEQFPQRAQTMLNSGSGSENGGLINFF